MSEPRRSARLAASATTTTKPDAVREANSHRYLTSNTTEAGGLGNRDPTCRDAST